MNMPQPRFLAGSLGLVILLAVTGCMPGPVFETETLEPLSTTTSVSLRPTSTPAPTRQSPTSTPTAAPTNPPPDSANVVLLGQTVDPEGDIPQSFLDVVAFQVTIDEGNGWVEAVFTMRDIPSMVDKGAVLNVIEYSLVVEVYLQADPPVEPLVSDYQLRALAFTIDFQAIPTPAGEGTEAPNTPVTGQASAVPVAELFDSVVVNDREGNAVSEPNLVVDPEADTITLSGIIPGIHAGAMFRFVTDNYLDARDVPDDFIRARNRVDARTGSPTPVPPVDPGREGALAKAGSVRAYPGPDIYSGDVLTLEIAADQGSSEGPAEAQLVLDGGAPFEVQGSWGFNRLILPLALDTRGLSGVHRLQVQVQEAGVDELFVFTILPDDQRPEQEETAVWKTSTLSCCTVHYIAHTAADRDIDLISAELNQATQEFEILTGVQVDGALDLYLIDRMWGNGAFGGGGELVVVYTDRYYGPSAGLAGLGTLAKHEFTHAVAIDQTEKGFSLYNEGLAVFVAGGHYKPEPVAQRAAALDDLGFHIKFGQSSPQHEAAYLYGAAVYSYIREKYGIERVWAFAEKASGNLFDTPSLIDQAIQDTLGIPRASFETEFNSWLASQVPGQQVDDLRLTIELQDLRRTYQETYTPPPDFIFGAAADALASPAHLLALIREPNSAQHMAVELMIAAGQAAIWEGDYEQAEALVTPLRAVLAQGIFADPLSQEYLGVVTALTEEGYIVLDVDIDGDEAVAQVTRSAPELEVVVVRRVDGTWQVGAR